MPLLMDFALSLAEADGAAARVESEGNVPIGVPVSVPSCSPTGDTEERRESKSSGTGTISPLTSTASMSRMVSNGIVIPPNDTDMSPLG